MKKVLLIAAILIFSGVYSLAQQMQQKVGYVDSQVMLSALPEAIKAQGQLDEIAKQWYAQADTMTSRLQQEYAQYQKQQGTMSQDELQKAQQSIVTKEQELNVFRQQKFGQTGDLFKKQEELFKPVKDRIMKGIEQVAQEEGMSFIFDKSGDIVLLYADDTFDITYKVLDKLKRGSK